MIIEAEIIASFASGVATIIGAVIASWRSKRGSTEVNDTDLPHIEKRLKELKEYLGCQESIEKRNSLAGGFLTIGQYIVGGILATSFIQETLSSHVIGFLGVLVLVSSIIHQRFRPDLKVAGARSRVLRLKKIHRSANDRLDRVRIEHNANSQELDLAENQIASSISTQISEIEEAEQQDLNNFEAIQFSEKKNN